MKVTFWAYAPSHEAEHESSGRFAGFCGNADAHGVCVCHVDCIAIDVVEMATWNEARRHGNYLGDFGPEDGVTDPDEPLQRASDEKPVSFLDEMLTSLESKKMEHREIVMSDRVAAALSDDDGDT